jgi:hypothetical protein
VASTDAHHRRAGVPPHDLTDKNADEGALFWILIAGIAACVAAILALIRLRAREVQYSEAIAHLCRTMGLSDPRPFTLKRKPVPLKWFHRPIDRPVRWVGAQRFYPTVYWVWIAALVLFGFADFVAYRATT